MRVCRFLGICLISCTVLVASSTFAQSTGSESTTHQTPTSAIGESLPAPDDESFARTAERLFFLLLTVASAGDVADQAQLAQQIFRVSSSDARTISEFAVESVGRYREFGSGVTQEICELQPSPTVRDRILEKLAYIREGEARLQQEFYSELQQVDTDLFRQVMETLESTAGSHSRLSFDLEVLRDPGIDLYQLTRRPC